jgi:hypothetical protein
MAAARSFPTGLQARLDFEFFDVLRNLLHNDLRAANAACENEHERAQWSSREHLRFTLGERRSGDVPAVSGGWVSSPGFISKSEICRFDPPRNLNFQ